MLPGKRIVLGVTGGIAAYKACEIASRLIKLNAEVRVVMTRNAAEFIAPLSLATISGNPVYVDQFSPRSEMEHISLSKWADLFLVAPATANILGKMACGIADDLLSSVAMAMPAPIMVAPAMNTNMWKNPATVSNVENLSCRGVLFIGPASGRLACGDEDIGRMSEPSEIVDAVCAHFERRGDFMGRRVLVTAGPTVEDIDPVRFISNRSSGKMGYAIAEAARDRGAEVVLITGPVRIAAPTGVKVVHIRSTADLMEAVMAEAEAADVILQAAAPADYRVMETASQKIKRGDGDFSLTLVPNPDIAKALGEKKRPGQVLVAFAAETGELKKNAREKMKKKNADMIVANDVSLPGAGFDVDTNIATLIGASFEEPLPLMEKRALANRILDKVLSLE